jgi:hypothetical protein
MTLRRRILLPLLVLLCAPGRSYQNPAGDGARVKPGSVALPGRETLSYGVEWRLIRAGRATLGWEPAPESGTARWQTSVSLESTGLVSRLYKVDDQYTSLLGADLCSLSSFMKAHEGSRRRETKVSFDGAAGKASYVERDLVKNNIVRSQEIDIPGCVHDVVGGLFLLRTLRTEPGETIHVPVSDGKKSVSARVEAQARETVKTPSGTHKTIRYEVFLFNDVLYRRSGHLYVWLTDDDRRVHVQIRARMKFHIGTITFQLEKEERS